MTVTAESVQKNVAVQSIAAMPPLHMWARFGSVGVTEGDSDKIIQAKMTAALNKLLERPVYDAEGHEVSPQLGRKPS